MKLFHAEPEKELADDTPELHEQLNELEETVAALRQIVGQRRTMLQNADKKLQEFQDMMYAMLIEQDAPKRVMSGADDPDDDDQFFVSGPIDVADLFPDDER